MFFRRSRELKLGEKTASEGIHFSASSNGDSNLDDVTIQAVEASLREALTLNNEEARALLGKIEYQRGNFEAALSIFDGIQAGTIFKRISFLALATTKPRHHWKARSRTEVSQEITLNAAGLLLEAVHLKVLALERMSRLTDAADECYALLDSFDSVFPHGLSDHLKHTKLQEVLNAVLEFLPHVLVKQGMLVKAIAAYRRALQRHWAEEIDLERFRNLQLDMAVLLLYGGVEAPPCPKNQYCGSFLPGNSLEEALLLLLTLAKASVATRTNWDARVMEHLCYALSISGHFGTIANLLESVVPGLYCRSDRWYDLALCYAAIGDSETALDLLQKSLNNVEKPNDVPSLLLAGNLCAGSLKRCSEGVGYGRKAVENAVGEAGYLKGRAWHLYGAAIGTQAKATSSSSERSRLQQEALSCLQEAASLDKLDANIRLQLGLEYAEQGELGLALSCAKKYLQLTSAAVVKAWRFLVLVLTAQQRHKEAEIVLEAALKESNNIDLLLTKSKLQIHQGKHKTALETYKYLLGRPDARHYTAEVWRQMASVYIFFSQWSDAERCLLEAAPLKQQTVSLEICHGYGGLYVAQEKFQEAMEAYSLALTLNPQDVVSKICLGALFSKQGCSGRPDSLAIARSYLNDALHSQPRNPLAWYYLGVVHDADSRLADAADCFQASHLLEQSLPIESFATVAAP